MPLQQLFDFSDVVGDHVGLAVLLEEISNEGNDESCEDDENVRYQLTPKGVACLAMLHAGLVTSVDDPRIEGFWSMFLMGI